MQSVVIPQEDWQFNLKGMSDAKTNRLGAPVLGVLAVRASASRFLSGNASRLCGMRREALFCSVPHN